MRKLLLAALSLSAAIAQEAYKKPPKEILDVLNAPVTPQESLSPSRDVLILREFAAPTDHSGMHNVSRCIQTRTEKQMARNLKRVTRNPSQARQYPIEIAINATPLP